MGLEPIFYLWNFSSVLSAKLNGIIAPAVTALGYELVGCELTSGGRGSLIRIYIDSPAGITVDDCERVSRQVSAILDVEDPIPAGYDLEVSSPGLDRPLFTLDHYRRFIGKRVRIRLHRPQNDRRNYTGVLKAVEQELVVVEGDGQIWKLPFADIEKGNLIPEF